MIQPLSKESIDALIRSKVNSIAELYKMRGVKVVAVEFILEEQTNVIKDAFSQN